MNRSLPPEPFIARLDAISRTRALTERESIALEKAIRTGSVCKREAIRLGLRQDMRVYLKRAEESEDRHG